MKLAIATLAVLFSTSVFAQSFSNSPRACTFEDWSRISSALDGQSMPIKSEGDALSTARSMIVQEFAPECTKLSLTAGVSIPGNKYEQYVIASGGTQIEIVVVTSLEENSTYAIVSEISQ